VKVCDKTCIFFFSPIINKYFLMAKRSLLSNCPSCIRGDEKHDISNDVATCTVLAVGLRRKVRLSWNFPECSKWSHNWHVTVGAKAGWSLPGKF
jgi:hypothetical protein